MVTNFFVDTSALLRRYIPETGSAWVLSWILPQAGNVIVISHLTEVESSSVLAHKQRETRLTAADVISLHTQFQLHVDKEYVSVLLDEAVIAAASSLVLKHPLRTLDAIQLASAVQAVTTLGEPMIFISGDTNLLNAATAEGFTTDNPYVHP